ncbi:DUF4214 domain-containing protein [Brevundimonas sp. VNH65]|uniref:DUF4214 domain-containing protein n=1 Tax=Brevundimonas sp. VNH65 TaxID=3400917 RepID=UPI003C0924B1
MATITGTSGNDTIVGTNGADTIYAGGGRDTVTGGGGDDVIHGEDGDDTLDGEAGSDTLYGGAGDDWLSATDEGGDDALYGGDGDDRLTLSRASGGHVILDGGAGNDTITVQQYGSTGSVTVSGGTGDDLIRLWSSGATISTGEGRDTLEFAASGTSTVTDFTAGSGGDVLSLAGVLSSSFGWNGSANPFSTGHLRLVQSGSDTLVQASNGSGGAFTTLAVLQNVTASTLTIDNLGFVPSAAPPSARVNAPATIREGESGELSVTFLNVSQLTTTITVTLSGTSKATGADVSFPIGVRQVSVSQVPARDYTVDLASILALDDLEIEGLENLVVQVRATGQVLGSGSDTILVNIGIVDNDTRGTNASDRLEGDEGRNALDGGDGNDTLYGNGGADWLLGGAGDDFLIGGTGDDRIDGGAGHDTAVFSGAWASARIAYDADRVIVEEGDGRDSLSGVEVLQFSDAVVDVIDGRVAAQARMRLEGTEKADTLVGGGSNDQLYGNAGNDRLRGGAGDDLLDGGAGVDAAEYTHVRRAHEIGKRTGDAQSVAGREGADQLVGVENLRFADGVLSYDQEGLEAQTVRLLDTLGLTANQRVFNEWLNQLERGKSLDELADVLLQTTAGGAAINSLASNADFIAQIARVALNREFPQDLSAYLGGLIDSGQISRADAVVMFSEGLEHRLIVAPTIDAGVWNESENAHIVARLFNAAFSRLPDSGTLSYVTSILDNGGSMKSVLDLFMGSLEFTSRYGGLSNADYVAKLSMIALGRPMDKGTVGYLASQIDNGGMTRADMLFAFSESLEHRVRTASWWEQGIRTTDTGGLTTATDDDFVLVEADYASHRYSEVQEPVLPASADLHGDRTGGGAAAPFDLDQLFARHGLEPDLDRAPMDHVSPHLLQLRVASDEYLM